MPTQQEPVGSSVQASVLEVPGEIVVFCLAKLDHSWSKLGGTPIPRSPPQK